jgi:hypothetical protein
MALLDAGEALRRQKPMGGAVGLGFPEAELHAQPLLPRINSVGSSGFQVGRT